MADKPDSINMLRTTSELNGKIVAARNEDINNPQYPYKANSSIEILGWFVWMM